ncbi:RadC family protein [Paenibacillus thalictri]|uniref:DNA repair protein RadC n=1 Tax=Paenibacillus thalictri TaxID=2527873 RepID=A0A4Q9DF03_9BACL|nr:DNA repair protein RadC [Paenibacillus thalictri]TBL69786.1 DNA repair protein RadC [Paenibacillus thalictri]
MNSYELSSIKSLFAETLAEKTGSYIIEEIFSRFPSLAELMDVTEQELLNIKGVGPRKAHQIMAALQLARRLNIPSGSPFIIRSPKDAADYLMPELRYLQQERFCLLHLNTKNHLIQKDIISIGTLNSAIVHPREVFRAAIKRSSASILLAHNHPSGDPSPSQEDISLTKRLVEVGEVVGIEVLDSLIIGDNRFLSLKEQGLM